MEYWKNAKGLEDVYLVSNLGNVKKIGKDNYHNKSMNGQGYYYVYNPLTKRVVSLHRIIANTFIPNKEEKPIVNHKDGNKANNNIDNLEWVTASENIKHAWDNNLIGVGGYKFKRNKKERKQKKEKKPRVVYDNYERDSNCKKLNSFRMSKELIIKAKEKAKSLNISYSKYIQDLVKKDLK
jgi:hypothetical protein